MKLSQIVAVTGLALSSLALAQESKPKPTTTPSTTPTTTPAAQPATTAKPTTTKPATATPATKTPAAQPVDPTSMTPDQAMQAWNAANPVTDEHHKMAMNLAGEWNTTCEFWMAPGTEPQKSTGKAKFTVMAGLQGRFVQQEYAGDFMGKPFKGVGIMGYNTVTTKYESMWIDSTTNAMMFETGTKDSAGNLDMHGTTTDPFTKQAKPTHSTVTHKDNNTFVEAMFETDEHGKEWKSFEITYTRVNANKELPAGKVEKAEPKKTTEPATKGTK